MISPKLKSVGKENVIYLSDYDNARTLALLKSNYKIDHEVYFENPAISYHL